MTLLRLKQVMRDHGIKKLTFNLYIIVVKHQNVVFDILSDFSDGFIFKYAFQGFRYIACLFLITWAGYKESLVVLIGNGYSHQFSFMRIDGGGFGVKTKFSQRL